jgi:hypothetical protein
LHLIWQVASLRAIEMRKRVKEMLLHKAQRVIDTFNEWDKDHSLTVDIE